jgi:WD40 repeat protein
MGDWLVQASEDNSIAAYSVHSPSTVKHLNGHTMPVISIDISDQGLLVSGSADGTIKTWKFN